MLLCWLNIEKDYFMNMDDLLGVQKVAETLRDEIEVLITFDLNDADSEDYKLLYDLFHYHSIFLRKINP